MRNSCHVVFSSRWSRFEQAMNLDDEWQITAQNYGQFRATV